MFLATVFGCIVLAVLAVWLVLEVPPVWRFVTLLVDPFERWRSGGDRGS